MIELYTGTPGSGKSLHLADTMKWALISGRPVIANFSFRSDLVRVGRDKMTGKKAVFCEVGVNDLDPEKLRSWALGYWNGRPVKEGHILLVIDEAQLLFNSREWGKKDRGTWLSFFTQHRKLGYDIILCCQFDQMLDKQIRACVEYQYIHRKISDGQLLARVIGLLFFNRLFVSVKVWYAMRERVDYTFFTARRRLYRLYNTHALLDESVTAGESPLVGSTEEPERRTRRRSVFGFFR